MTAIESLQNQILEQQKYLENHEKILRKIVKDAGGTVSDLPPLAIPRTMGSISRPPNEFHYATTQSLHRNPEPYHPAPPQNFMNPLLNIAPMVSGLVGVLNTMQPTPTSSEIEEDEEEEIEGSVLDENEIKAELKDELAELKDPSEKIKEGRIDKIEMEKEDPSLVKEVVTSH